MKKSIIFSALWAAAFFSQAALADAGGGPAYVGVGVGQSYARSLEHADYTTWDNETANSAWKIFGGFRFTPNVGVEVAYTGLAWASFSYADPGLNGSGDISSRIYSVAATGRIPLAASFALTGKLGAASITNKTSDSWNGGSLSDRRSSTVALIGVGAEYAVTRDFSLRAEYEAYGKAEYAGAAGGNPKLRLDAVTVGLGYHF